MSSVFDHMTKPGLRGQHPKFSHLVYAEIEPHCGSYILTFPQTFESGDLLISADDAEHIFGDQLDDGFAYIADDYLDLIEDPVSIGFSEFWNGYLIGLAFTCFHDCERGCGEPPEVWQNPGGDVSDVVEPSDVESALKSCDAFKELRGDAVAFWNDCGLSEDAANAAGSDFHLTRNRHGAGFWDGDWPENGDRLAEQAWPFGSAELVWRFTENENGECEDRADLDSSELSNLVFHVMN